MRMLDQRSLLRIGGQLRCSPQVPTFRCAKDVDEPFALGQSPRVEVQDAGTTRRAPVLQPFSENGQKGFNLGLIKEAIHHEPSTLLDGTT